VGQPVWDVYDSLRTARLNWKYYGCRLVKTKRMSFIIDLVLAISASSAVGGLWLFAEWQNGLLWRVLGSFAAVLAIYNTTARLGSKIQEFERRATGWQAIEFDLDRIARKVRATREYGEELQAQFEVVMDRQHELAKTYVDPGSTNRLKRPCEEEVLRELPVDTFFIPEEQHA
jgi:hypothetical protein